MPDAGNLPLETQTHTAARPVGGGLTDSLIAHVGRRAQTADPDDEAGPSNSASLAMSLTQADEPDVLPGKVKVPR